VARAIAKAILHSRGRLCHIAKAILHSRGRLCHIAKAILHSRGLRPWHAREPRQDV
jgi:hypothetical protein